MRAATQTGCMTATDLADYLVQKGVPFRKAHAIVGETVAYCIKNGKELAELGVEELTKFSTVIEQDVCEVLSIEGSIESRKSIGGTSLVRVTEAVEAAEKNCKSRI